MYLSTFSELLNQPRIKNVVSDGDSKDTKLVLLGLDRKGNNFILMQ